MQPKREFVAQVLLTMKQKKTEIIGLRARKHENQTSSDEMTILEQIQLLRLQIIDLRKQLEAFKQWVNWNSTFVGKLLDVVGIPKYHPDQRQHRWKRAL